MKRIFKHVSGFRDGTKHIEVWPDGSVHVIHSSNGDVGSCEWTMEDIQDRLDRKVWEEIK